MSKQNIFLSFLPQKKHPHYKSKPDVSALASVNQPSFEGKNRLVFDQKIQKKALSPKFANTPQAQSGGHFLFPKSPLDQLKNGYLLSGLISRNSEAKPESIPQERKNLNACVVQLNVNKEKLRFNVDLTNKTSDYLLEILIEKARGFEGQSSREDPKSNGRPIIGFTNNSGFILIDFILTLKNVKLDFLHNMILVFNPIYADTTFLRNRNSKQCLKNFEFLKLIGSGGFSKVFLARSKINGKYHAIKLIDRHFIKTHQKEGIVLNERNILASMNHPNIIKLDYAFKSKKYIVFVMEFCAGGELFFHLKRLKRMSENEARVYFLELCLGIKHLHEKFVVYRDIKPENILLDIDGHVKIADFGLAKPEMNILRKAHSFCGSPEYMAPEMLQKRGHDYSVDYYCLGAILYELVIGSPPFYTTHTSEMFERILTEEISFPDDLDLSEEIMDLITNLLIKEPKYRRGAMGGIKEILAHPWCKKMSLKDIEARTVATPIKPNVFEFYVDEVSDDGDLASKMQDIYDEAFDDLSESDENEQIFKNFYFEAEKPEPPLNQKTERVRQGKSKDHVSACEIVNQSRKSPKPQVEEILKTSLTHSMNEEKSKEIPKSKHKWSDNFLDSSTKTNNEPYFIADQYRAKKPVSNGNAVNVYSAILKTQKSLEHQLSTTQKEKILSDKKQSLALKKTNTEANYNFNAASKFQPYIPVNKHLLQIYKERQHCSKEDVYFKNAQKPAVNRKSPLNLKTTNSTNISNVNVSHVKKTEILSSINLISLLKLKQKENVQNRLKLFQKNSFLDEKASLSKNKLNTEPSLSPDWSEKKLFLNEDGLDCKETVRKLEKKLKESSRVRKSEEGKFFVQMKKRDLH